MRADDWHLTAHVDDFLARAGEFLRERPALHTMQLTAAQTRRTSGADAHGGESPVFGWLERAGQVCATLTQNPRRRVNVTTVSPEQADALAASLAHRGHPLPGVAADAETAAAFAGAWQRRTGATPELKARLRLYRLGDLTWPNPFPEGQGRIAGEQDREQLVRWLREFDVSTRSAPSVDANANVDGTTTANADVNADVNTSANANADADADAAREDPRLISKRFMLWETSGGTPVSMAGMTPVVAGQVRVDPVYTPARLRGHGYAGAVTAEVSRVAVDAGATEVVLFTDLANPTSNALYQRIGYVPVTGFASYDFC